LAAGAVARKLDSERQTIEATIKGRLEEEYRLRIADKEKALHDARKVNEELYRKLQQGSQQSQGEVLELRAGGHSQKSVPRGPT
jgi:hypothetical protein